MDPTTHDRLAKRPDIGFPGRHNITGVSLITAHSQEKRANARCIRERRDRAYIRGLIASLHNNITFAVTTSPHSACEQVSQSHQSRLRQSHQFLQSHQSYQLQSSLSFDRNLLAYSIITTTTIAVCHGAADREAACYETASCEAPSHGAADRGEAGYFTMEPQIDLNQGLCLTVTYPTRKPFTHSPLRLQIKGLLTHSIPLRFWIWLATGVGELDVRRKHRHGACPGLRERRFRSLQRQSLHLYG